MFLLPDPRHCFVSLSLLQSFFNKINFRAGATFAGVSVTNRFSVKWPVTFMDYSIQTLELTSPYVILELTWMP